MPGKGDTGIALSSVQPSREGLLKTIQIIGETCKRLVHGDLVHVGNSSEHYPLLRQFFAQIYQVMDHATERLELLKKYEKGNFRAEYVESERGWKTEYFYRYFDTAEEAKKTVEQDKSPGGNTPDYYCVAKGTIEQFDMEKKEWRKITII